jgi:hypothetical protein
MMTADQPSDGSASSSQQGDEGDDHERASTGMKPATPLPWKQLIIIMLMRLAEPVAFSLIFPFIGDMIWDLGATQDRGDVGMYAGIVVSDRRHCGVQAVSSRTDEILLQESIFAAVQTLTV